MVTPTMTASSSRRVAQLSLTRLSTRLLCLPRLLHTILDYVFALTVIGMTSSACAAAARSPDPNLIARGAYLAKVGDCAACHTAPGTPDFSGGFAVKSPLGTIYSSNITPDPTSGIGNFSFDDFARALREGVSKDGTHLYPAMPYASFTKVGDDDVRALYAYFLHGVKPVHSQPPETKLPFPFNQRWGLWFWDLAFKPHGRFEPRTDRSVEWNRGAYLVQGLGHCGACHTPRGPAYEELGYDDHSISYLTGGVNDHWYASNLSADPASGLGRWTASELVEFLRHGVNTHGIVFGSMKQTFDESLSAFSAQDLAAVAVYLKSFPGAGRYGNYSPGSKAAADTQHALDTGEAELPGAGIYLSACAQCHGSNGAGIAHRAPALAGNPAVLGENPSSVIRIVLEGGETPSLANGAPETMPAFNQRLNDNEIAAVVTLIRQAWGNQADPVSQRTVRVLRRSLR
jgi:mono/diheme cytochrome c family protein